MRAFAIFSVIFLISVQHAAAKNQPERSDYIKCRVHAAKLLVDEIGFTPVDAYNATAVQCPNANYVDHNKQDRAEIIAAVVSSRQSVSLPLSASSWKFSRNTGSSGPDKSDGMAMQEDASTPKHIAIVKCRSKENGGGLAFSVLTFADDEQFARGQIVSTKIGNLAPLKLQFEAEQVLDGKAIALTADDDASKLIALGLASGDRNIFLNFVVFNAKFSGKGSSSAVAQALLTCGLISK